MMTTHEKQKSVSPKDEKSQAEKTIEESLEMKSRASREESKEIQKTATEDPKEKQIEALRKSLDEEKKKSEQYLTSLKYLRAELENYQKRTARDMDELVKRGSERLAGKLLGIVDDLERTINASKAIGESSKLISGIEMILKELLKILKSEGIVKIEAVGRKFTPELHEAVTVTKTDKCPVDTVIEEVRAGYKFDDRVLRPSMVVVSCLPEKNKPATDNQGSNEEEQVDDGDTSKETNKGE
ncbi:MAG: nucleotide exchange factor GrpE [Candidatus Atabeyarchaeum deiterrae]